MNELTVKDTQVFMGKEIPVVVGGFGENCKCVTDKMVAEIHAVEAREIRRLIKDNFKRFKESIDIIDLKRGVGTTHTLDLTQLGYTKSTITQANNIFLLSERGYAKLIKIMDSDLAWEIHDKLIDEYFTMRETINSLKLTRKQELALALFDGGLDAITAHKQLVQIETEPLVEKITVLEPKADYHDKVLNANNYLTITEIAKDLGMTGNRLNKILCEIKVQYKKGKKYALYAEHDGKGYVDYKTSLPDDRGVTHIRMCWTEVGRKFIVDKLEKLELI